MGDQVYELHNLCISVYFSKYRVLKPLVLILLKGYKASLIMFFILVSPYLYRELQSVQDIIEMIKKGNCRIISDNYNSYDEDSILDIDIRRDFLLKDAIREVKKKKNLISNKIIRVCPCTPRQCYAEGFDIGGPRHEFWRLLVQNGKGKEGSMALACQVGQCMHHRLLYNYLYL